MINSILFENDDVLAVNKPDGLASIPERGRTDCLLRSLESRYAIKLWVVHRLDKEVSGVMLFAKNAHAHKFLNAQFQNRRIVKTYRAVTHGIISEEHGVINGPLRQFGSGRMGVDAERGKPSLTEFEVIHRFREHTMVTAYPHTGRRHQIRVHLYSIGHPIAGDLKYGDRKQQVLYERLMLHAVSIRFMLLSEEILTVEAPVPTNFQQVCDSLAE